MIPDAAVEAALNARLTFKNQRSMDNDVNLMRHILEAAAPHLLADGWDEGFNYGVGREYYDIANNPYRPTP